LVQKDATSGRTQLVLLDHGLYKTLTDDFRLDYCHLWLGLINRDEEAIAEFSQRLGVKDYMLFASMLTARAWHTVKEESAGLGSKLSDAERDHLRVSASKHAAEICNILDRVPQQLLLLLKTNDLLRSVNEDLGRPINPYTLTLRRCVETVYRHEAQSPSFRVRARAYKNMWLNNVRLWLFEFFTWLVRIVRSMATMIVPLDS
jgi:aarF domain-containing kinase